jgi:catechol 2,3-dioxygenase-like lactoylglutathione lyase family enzyme
MTVHVAQWTLDVQDVDRMARFWSAALGYLVDAGADGNAKLYPPPERASGAPTVWLQASGTEKPAKNRLHLDVVAQGDPHVEVRRLVSLGARLADVGQDGTEQFTVLVDPEGNEFCVLDHAPQIPGADG